MTVDTLYFRSFWRAWVQYGYLHVYVVVKDVKQARQKSGVRRE